jgi:SAM-dependent methyltransferase
MTGWSGGYVTDIEYQLGHYPEQSPYLLAVACLINGIDIDPPWQAERLHYLELGAGRGLNAMVLAAANPHWQVTAVDFMPSAIADARRWAARAGLDNITFIEADLATLAGSAAAEAIPAADVASLHGVWSWVPAPVQAGIVRLLDAKVRAGGMVHISYNVLPALQGVIGMQRLMRDAGRRLAGRTDRQVAAGREVVEALVKADARQLTREPMVAEMMKTMERVSVEYLAHEFMNAAWTPCFHADVAAALEAARLTFVGSVRLAENFDELILTEAQRAVLNRFDDPAMRELIKDTCIDRTLRHDVFVRGAARLAPAARDAMLAEVWLASTVRPQDFTYEVTLPAGRATLGQGFYEPVVDALAEGPRRVGELLALPQARAHDANPAELIAMLVGTQRAALVGRPQAGPDPRIRRFNATTARRLVQLSALDRPVAMASTRLGAGVICQAVELFLVDRIAASGGPVDPGIWAAELGPGLDGDEHDRLRALLGRVIDERAAIWRNLGLV